ncbi:arylsulfatase [Actinorhabdospora filicis]|uniref:Arylsulfatase n=1 Tax=Actinorhabdospora filicis TaxID=1785913 RepID=A0A9W6WAL5_9ACTN|nr:sulfatase-like hydrolase/transferase [Actinorhabdospora filicis]GLZ78726.1 arylsulfatase [Actinorhabdospora filicis]
MSSPRRPNVIWIVSDDHGYADRSRLGVRDDVSTPALDRLAGEGVSCTEAYVSAPICSPSRAGLVTGAHQRRWGVRWFDDAAFAPEGMPTVAELMRGEGYATGYFGKVHYGPERPGDRACPENHGFGESFYGLAGMQQGRLNYLRHSSAAVDEYGPEAAWRMGVLPLRENGEEAELEGFLTWELGRRARDFVTRHAGEPFFLQLAFNAVHNFTWQLPDEELAARGLPRRADWDDDVSDYLDWYDGAISPHLEHGREYYLAQLELMDAEIGKLLDLLDERGLAENTLVVYLTDNGGSACNYGDNAPLSGSKYTLWEGGVRVPMIARWPGGGLPSGVDRDGLVSALDLAPTALAAAGGAWDGFDGRDQLAHWRGEAGSPHEALYWDCGFQWAVRDARYKLRHADGGDPTARAIAQVEHTAVGDGTALFDLAADPGETRDLSAELPGVAARLRAEWERWRDEVGAGQSS